MYWLKLYIEILDDPKMGRLPDNVWRRAIELFMVAKEHNQDGHLPDIEELAWRLRIEPEQLTVEVEQLLGLGILETNDGTLVVTNFATRQAPSPVKERVARHRDKKRREQEESNDMPAANGNETVTKGYQEDNDCNAPEAETEAEAETEQNQPPGAKAPKRAPTGKNAIKAALESRFSEITSLPKPVAQTAAQRKAAGTRWWSPLSAIATLTDGDAGEAMRLMETAVAQMDTDGLTISAPQSILAVCQSIHGKQQRGISDNGRNQSRAAPDPMADYARLAAKEGW